MAQNEVYISILSGHNLYNTEFISKQDPYVCVHYNGLIHTTKVAEDQGTEPKWADKFVLRLLPGVFDVRFTVKNKNHITGDDEIGTTLVHFQRVLTTGNESFEADVFHASKPKGKLRLHFEYPYARNPIPMTCHP
eukprot:TRINITY_DN165_c0_g1_i2.p1 TRINITY_DN165_c0_g1~~TRINITY_DN165_c0_g1_i2.p1  ORF type:complete len:135 (+),score=15.05 TRINITY_DN165_c0_g1_i2:158-562(+)